jgi:hypothetical protein
MPIIRQRVAKHIPAETNARNNRTSIAKQRHSKQIFSTIQTVFSVESAKSGYKKSPVPKLVLLLWKDNENGTSPRQSRKKGSAEDSL